MEAKLFQIRSCCVELVSVKDGSTTFTGVPKNYFLLRKSGRSLNKLIAI